MLSESERKEVLKQFKMLQMLWFCMLASPAFCVLMSQMLANAINQNTGDAIQVVDVNVTTSIFLSAENVVYAFAAILMLLGYFFRKLALEGRIKVNQGYRFKRIKPDFFGTYYVATIIPLSLMNIVGMSGMALFLAGHGFRHVYILAAAGTLGIYLCRPKKEEIEELGGMRIFDGHYAEVMPINPQNQDNYVSRLVVDFIRKK